jgi:hypothetical protein
VADLTDKEVGELWREWSVVENDDAWPEAKPICDLIRKLVKERAYRYECEGFLTQGERMSIESFGIDPTTWPT